MVDVICVGQAVLDCVTRGREARPYRENVYRAETIRLHTGGDAVNESMTMAGLGVRTAIVCALGRDIAGGILLDRLERAGVDTRRVSVREGMDTPVANLQVALDGSRFSVNSGAVALPGYRPDPASVRGARLVSLASLFRPPLADPDGVEALAREAKAQGALLCADTKLPLTEGLGLDSFRRVLPLVDYLFPNEKEAAHYTGQSDFPAMARALRDRGVANVIIKAGPAGCFVSGSQGEFALPALPVERVVDTTGAGDHFVAGFYTGLLEGATLMECARRGLREAASAISHTGGGSAAG